MPNSSETNQFIEAMSELQYYVDETESYKKEKSGEKKQKGKKVSKASDYESKDPIPRAETRKIGKISRKRNQSQKQKMLLRNRKILTIQKSRKVSYSLR